MAASPRCDAIHRLLSRRSLRGTGTATTRERRRAVEALMSPATASASALVPISCGWSKRSAPAQMRVTAEAYPAGDMLFTSPALMCARVALAEAAANAVEIGRAERRE